MAVLQFRRADTAPLADPDDFPEPHMPQPAEAATHFCDYQVQQDRAAQPRSDISDVLLWLCVPMLVGIAAAWVITIVQPYAPAPLTRPAAASAPLPTNTVPMKGQP